MSVRTDLALYDRDGQLAAVVEIKNKLGTSSEWAAKLRRNILAHGGFRSVEFFLLVTPDRLYLWKGVSPQPTPAPPTHEIDAAHLLQPYFDHAGLDPSHASGSAFELIVAAWLADLMRSEGPCDVSNEQNPLASSGFPDAVRNGRVEYEVAA